MTDRRDIDSAGRGSPDVIGTSTTLLDDLEDSACPMTAQGHDRITLVGLVLETAAGLRRLLAPGLDCELGVGGQSFEILLRLSRSPDDSLRMADLAGQTGLTPSGLTRAVDRLSDVGLVSREACPNDRRGAFAILTPLGRERMDEAVARHRVAVDELLDGVLAPDDEERLRTLLAPLRDRVHPGATLGAREVSPTRGAPAR